MAEERTRDPGGYVIVVGPCGAGKTTLVRALRARGIRAREIPQEHSGVRDLWRRFWPVAVLLYLDVSHEEANRRQGRSWFPRRVTEDQRRRLAPARAAADRVIPTDGRTPQEVLEEVLAFLAERGIGPAADPEGEG